MTLESKMSNQKDEAISHLMEIPCPELNSNISQYTEYFLSICRISNGNKDLNGIIEEIEERAPGSEIKIQYAMIQAIVHDVGFASKILEVLWQYINNGESYRASGLRYLVGKIFSTDERPAPITIMPNKIASLAVLLILLEGTQYSLIDYKPRIIKSLISNPKDEQNIDALECIKRFQPRAVESIAVGYANEINNRRMRFISKDLDNVAIVECLFKETGFMHIYGGMAVLDIVYPHTDEYSKNEIIEDIKLTKLRIDTAFKWMKVQGKDKYYPEVVKKLKHVFRALIEKRCVNNEDIAYYGSITMHYIEHASKLGLGFMDLFSSAILHISGDKEEGVIKASGNLILQTDENMVAKIMGSFLLSEIETEALIETFIDHQDVLSEIYRVRGDEQIIPYLDLSHRQACLHHDLGI